MRADLKGYFLVAKKEYGTVAKMVELTIAKLDLL
jgi:hypothetical protein